MSKERVRINEQAAGYMELPDAVKDGECLVVAVGGGISKKKGCCSNFWPPVAKAFRCGQCDYVEGGPESKGKYDETDKSKRLSKREARSLSDEDLLNSDREIDEDEEPEEDEY